MQRATSRLAIMAMAGVVSGHVIGGQMGMVDDVQCLRHWLLSLVPPSARQTSMASKSPSALTTFRYVVSCGSDHVIEPDDVLGAENRPKSINRKAVRTGAKTDTARSSHRRRYRAQNPQRIPRGETGDGEHVRLEQSDRIPATSASESVMWLVLTAGPCSCNNLTSS